MVSTAAIILVYILMALTAITTVALVVSFFNQRMTGDTRAGLAIIWIVLLLATGFAAVGVDTSQKNFPRQTISPVGSTAGHHSDKMV